MRSDRGRERGRTGREARAGLNPFTGLARPAESTRSRRQPPLEAERTAGLARHLGLRGAPAPRPEERTADEQHRDD
jgi:hypothetical protein